MLWGVGVSAVGMASVLEQWLLHGSRFWEDRGAQHICCAFGLPGGSYQFIYLLVCLFFRAFFPCHPDGMACYVNQCIVVGYGVMYVVGVAYIIVGERVYFTSYIRLGSVA